RFQYFQVLRDRLPRECKMMFHRQTTAQLEESLAISLDQFVKNRAARGSSDCLEDIAHRRDNRQVMTCLSRSKNSNWRSDDWISVSEIVRISSAAGADPSHHINRKSGAHCHPRLRNSGAIREPWCWGPRSRVLFVSWKNAHSRRITRDDSPGKLLSRILERSSRNVDAAQKSGSR